MNKYESQPWALPEGIDMEKNVIATYYCSIPKDYDMLDIGAFMAVEQSTGTWVPVPGETPEVRSKHVAKVIGVYEAPYYEWGVPENITERQYIVQIAFPSANFEDKFSMLLTATVGNISMIPNLKVIDLRIPKETLKGYQGPKFGIDGWYEALGMEKGRPLLNNMIKPCSGYPLEVGVDLFYKAALGGCDVIKGQVYEETGEHTLYCVNVTDRLPRMFEVAKRVVEAGANAMMVNYIAVGHEAMRALAEDPDINVPILAHMDVAGAYFMSPNQGISSPLILGKTARMCGADAVVIPFAQGGKGIYMPDRFKQSVNCMVYPFGDLKPTLPMPSGGITPANVADAVNSMGKDIMIGSGGGIHAHPQGPTAGAKAFRQAIDAALKGIPLEEYAKDNEELGRALGLWGKKTE
ncbi:MAG: ribulose 1,5-bisphosphate carboxylase, partial [Deltaproteobacteria bacterium]|nr:ribulose 1,5-bisphosphate carboxylase [Deltaproteobacteria bacterium]